MLTFVFCLYDVHCFVESKRRYGLVLCNKESCLAQTLTLLLKTSWKIDWILWGRWKIMRGNSMASTFETKLTQVPVYEELYTTCSLQFGAALSWSSAFFGLSIPVSFLSLLPPPPARLLTFDQVSSATRSHWVCAIGVRLWLELYVRQFLSRNIQQYAPDSCRSAPSEFFHWDLTVSFQCSRTRLVILWNWIRGS